MGLTAQWAVWARVENDDRVHMARGLGSSKTLCDLPLRAHVVSAIPKPLQVDCRGCLDAGAINMPPPYESSHHNAWREVRG